MLDTPQAMQNLISTLAQFKRTQQRQIVIVHGGGCIVDELMQRLNLPVQKNRAYALHRRIKLILLPAHWRELPIKNWSQWQKLPV